MTKPDKKQVVLYHPNAEMRVRLAGYIIADYHISATSDAQQLDALIDEKKPTLAIIAHETLSISELTALSKKPVAISIIADAPVENELRFQMYDIGVIDILYFPLTSTHFQHKVEINVNYAISHQTLTYEVNASKDLTNLLMANIGEFGVILHFIKNCFSCRSFVELEHAIIQSLKSYDLSACIRIDVFDKLFEFSTEGIVKPLESQLMEQCRHSNKIMEFENRCFFNQKHISIFIKNMPQHDPEKIGRLKDHLAIIIDATEEKIVTLMKDEKVKEHADKMNQLMIKVKQKFSEHESKLIKLMDGMMDQFNVSFISLDLTEDQEEYLLGILDADMRKLITVYSESTQIERQFDTVISDLSEFIRQEFPENDPNYSESEQDEEDDDAILF